MSPEVWNKFAQDLGFSTEEDMLRYLYKDHTMKAIGIIIGVAETTIFYRFKRHSIKSRSHGCPNVTFCGKRGNPLSTESIRAIKRQYSLMYKDECNWRELGRRCNVNEVTAKKYALM